jgi:hypothetical protein
MKTVGTCVISGMVALGAFGAPGDSSGPREASVPFSAIRLRKRHTDSMAVWKATLAQFAKYRAGVDDVWFSTGICFPRMDEHRAAAKRLAIASDDLRKLGILPSLQIQATIGHGDSLVHHADNTGIAWQGYMASDGSVSHGANCPRAKGFHAYLREMVTLYAAAMRPYSVWIDDDIRIINHHSKGGGSGWGCHCDYCLSVFAGKEGRTRTRTELLSEMERDAALAARWRAFAFESEVEIVRTVAEAVRAVSPQTRICQQQPGACFPEHRMLYDAAHRISGLPVGMRPGAGAYLDYDPRDQISKAYYLAIQIETIGHPSYLDRICPEIETCPRSFGCRTGRGIFLEALESLSQGMNAISVFALDGGYETPEWYGDEIIAPIARNASMLKRYVAVNEGAERSGYAVSGLPNVQMRTCSIPFRPTRVKGTTPLPRLLSGDAVKAAVAEGRRAVENLLAQDLVLDGSAAESLASAGYCASIGLKAAPGLCAMPYYSLRERLTDASVNKSFKARETPIDGKAYLLQPVSDATVIAQYVSDMNAQTDPRVSAYLFETSDGKRRAVFGQMIFDRALRTASGDRILQLHRVLDWVAHKRAPVVLETPTRSFVQPRVRTDGTLASVVFINASVGDSAPVRLRLRRVPSTARQAIWSSYDSKDMPLTIVREGADALVTLPRLGPWTAGYLFFD